MSSAPAYRLGNMSKVTCQISISLDGYMAGPDQSVENPLGVGGKQLHEWFFGGGGQAAVDAEVGRTQLDGNGAYILGRNMFGPIRGEWDLSWRGWWAEDPPYHTPVFVLTHYPREPLEMEGGTTFHFVTGGFDEALARAREAAGPDLNVAIGGGASTLNQALAAGAVDELFLHHSPVVLGAGERLFEGLDVPPRLEIVETIASPATTHVRYRVVAPA
jgi:dihydrofolate reductase